MIASGAPEEFGAPMYEMTDEVGPLRQFGFLIDTTSEDGMIDLLVQSDADIWVEVQTLGGITVDQAVESTDPFRTGGTDDQLYFDQLAEGGEDAIATAEPGLYQVVVGSFSDDIVDIQISSANEIYRFADVEELSDLPTGRIVEGQFDWSRDTDRWQLDLEAGQSLSLRADGIADTVLVVRLDDDVVASSDDEGLGIFGTGSELEYVAEETGTYVVEIGSYDRTRWGYLIEATLG